MVWRRTCKGGGKMNKPKRDRSIIKTVNIVTKVSKGEHEEILGFAQKIGVTKSMLLRMAALEFIRKREK